MAVAVHRTMLRDGDDPTNRACNDPPRGITPTSRDTVAAWSATSPRFTDDPAVEHNPHNEHSPFLVKTIGAPPWIPRSPTRMPLARYSLHWRAGA